MNVLHFVPLLILWQLSLCKPSCERISMRGLDPDEFPFAHHYEGIYRRIYPDDPPAYVHETKEIVLRFESPSYMVFAHVGSDAKSILYVEFSEDYDGESDLLDLVDNNPFRLLIRRWLFRDPITNEFFPLSSDARFHCAPKHMHHCSANIFRFSGNVLRKSHGHLQYAVQTSDDFVVLDRIHNLRPVYYSATKDLYLFYDGHSHWVVSFDVGGNAIMRVKHKAYRPEYITRHWDVLFERKTSVIWKQDRDIYLECGASVEDLYSSNVPCEDFNPCQNQGTCYESHMSRYCLCKEGYYGIICESVREICEPDDSYIAPGVPKLMYLGSPYNQYVGNIAVSPCPTENGVEYTQAVCVYEQGSTMWHGDKICEITPVEPQPTLSSSLNNQDYLPTEEINKAAFNEYHFNGLQGHSVTITVAVIIVVIQILIPALVYMILKLRHRQSINTRQVKINRHMLDLQALEEKRDSVMREISSKYPGAIYSTEEGSFLFVKDGLYTEEQKHSIAMEYHNADCQLRAEVDDIKANHDEDLDRHQYIHQVSLKRYLSACCFFSLWVWLVIFTIQISLKSYNWNQTEAVFTSIGFGVCIFSYCFMILESMFCEERKDIMSMNKYGHVDDYIAMLRESQPVLLMSVACHHFGLRSNSMFGRKENGSFKTLTTTSPEKIITYRDERLFEYNMWVDNSQDVMAFQNKSIVKIRITKKVNFGDTFSKECFNQELAGLRKEYEKKDQFVQYSVQAHIDNFKDYIVLNNNAPSVMASSVIFWISTVMGLTWVFRMIFRTYVVNKSYKLAKTIYCSPVSSDDVSVNKFDTTKADLTKQQIKLKSSKGKTVPMNSDSDSIFRLSIDENQKNICLPKASMV